MNDELAVRKEGTVRAMPELNMDIIKKFICPAATDQEAYTFLQLCKAQNLNPFLREAYLIKYGNEAASIVVGKDTFTKRADRLAPYNGFKAGIIVLSQAKVQYREGSFFVTGEELLGGWAEVYRKDRTNTYRNEVTLSEYIKYKNDGSIQKNWKIMPATMIRKIALVQSLREAFPDEFGGQYAPEEIVDSSELPTYEVDKRPEIPPPSGKPFVDKPREQGNGESTQPSGS